MKLIVCILFVVGVSFVTTTVQENIEAVQIVKRNENCTLQYVKDNKLEKILNSVEIRDRYVAVISIVGLVQSGKSLLLNLFLNYLRKTYKIWSPFTTKTYESDWTSMNITNGFNATQNRNGTTKGIWAWPEIFIHDNITYGTESGNKVAIILLDTEGLFHIETDLRHNTMIFALSTMFSSMQGYNVFKDVNGDTMQFLDIFSTYTVYGSRIASNQISDTTETPFQDFYFIVRESDNPDESEKHILKRIFPDEAHNDQNRVMKARIKSVFKKIRAFQLPRPGENVTKPTFDGNVTQIDQRFKDKVATVVPDILAPENIVIKEINGERVKAKELSHFLQTFTDIVQNNITIATTLVEVLANASNWMVYQKYLQHYDDLMWANLSAKNATKSYFQEGEFQQVHLKNKNASMSQFKNRIKLGGDKLASPFEKLLNVTIDEHLIHFRESNDKMRLQFVNDSIAQGRLDAIKVWILIGAVGVVILFAVVQTLRKKPECFAKCRKRPNQGGAISEKAPVKR